MTFSHGWVGVDGILMNVSQPTRFAADLLEASASAYAGYAAGLLLERHPEIAARYAPSAMRSWKTNLTQRALELAAALAAEEPEIFGARVRWAHKSFHARDLELKDLHASLACLGEVLREEMPERVRGQVAAYVDPVLSSLAVAVNGGSATPPPHALGLDSESASGRLTLRYLQRVLEGDSRAAIDFVVAAADGGTPVEELYLDVLLAAQREVGDLWHLGEIGVAEEHHVTATTERAMAVLAQRAERRPAVGKTVVAAAVEANGHGLGVRVLCDFFEIAGWRSICLGADVPPSEIATSAVYFDADLVVLSAALAVQLQAVGRSIEALRALEDREIEIMVGGGAFTEAPELWRRLGADGYAATVRDAVELGGRLVGITQG